MWDVAIAVCDESCEYAEGKGENGGGGVFAAVEGGEWD